MAFPRINMGPTRSTMAGIVMTGSFFIPGGGPGGMDLLSSVGLGRLPDAELEGSGD